MPDMDTWVRAYQDLAEPGWQVAWASETGYLEHLNGIGWWQAPVPPRHHQCRAQTRGSTDSSYIERCACGGTLFRGRWLTRNARTPGDFDAPRRARHRWWPFR